VIRVLYHYDGEGTVAKPATVGFTFVNQAQTPPIEAMREKLPTTVVLEETEGIGFRLKGVNPRMTLEQLLHVWRGFASSNRWLTRHEG
jgi:hypothetical protein